MIPFNRPSIVGRELDYVRCAVASGVISGEGGFGKRCESLLEAELGAESHVLLTPSCTAALEMCALLLNLTDGDEVIMPSFTFVSSASAFVLRGARPKFVDVEQDSLNICPKAVEAAITPRTKAIVVVHYAGYACRMDEIMALSRRYRIPVIEDAAHALGATYNGRRLGTIGTFGTFSFHETKNVTCGEGGALVVNDQSYLDLAHIIRDKGTDRRRFKRGDVQFYQWVSLGSSFVLSDILSGFLLGQLECLAQISARRQELLLRYSELLQTLRLRGDIDYPQIDKVAGHGAHLFFLTVANRKVRDHLREFMARREITVVSHYEPLHLSQFIKSTGSPQPILPVTEAKASTLLRLPMFYELSGMEQERIATDLSAFFS